MLFVDNENVIDPRLNLALEEYFLRQIDGNDTFLLLYVNRPSVIIGRNQNVWQEADLRYLKAHDIELVRRLSGGGTVYHDSGNLNFSFVVPGRQGIHDFARFTQPVIEALSSFGIAAEMRKRGALFVGDKKISGHAQFVSGQRVLSHGTLLFDSNLTHLSRAIMPPMSSVESKAVSSIRSQVVNLRQLLPAGVDMAALRQALLHTLFDSTVPLYRLSAAEWEQVRALSTARFETWAWNVARSPRCTIRKNGRLAAGEVDVTLEIDRGRIQELRIDGDWLDERETAVLASRFAGIKYDLEALTQQLQMIELPSHFERTSKQDFLDLLY